MKITSDTIRATISTTIREDGSAANVLRATSDTIREDGSAGAYLPSCKDPEGYHQHYQTPTGKMVGKMVATPSATPSGLPSGLPATNREDGSAGAYLPSCKDPEGYHQGYQLPTGKMVVLVPIYNNVYK